MYRKYTMNVQYKNSIEKTLKIQKYRSKLRLTTLKYQINPANINTE